MTQFEDLYQKCFKDVYRYLCALSGSEELAEELTSETFFKAMNALDSFRGDCDEKVWLLRIAKNCFYTHARKSRRKTSLEPIAADMLHASAEGPEEAAIRRSEAERARAALQELPETYREVFMWRLYGELSFRQLGKVFGKSENWACVTYHRARKMLRERLEVENS